ncbi:hypothetical protein [Streptacidiphilus monticola]|uniref:Uncharacterized protein n=1 Tax=Streptacidiphilus monticola TaxID=2161674 RepID=A0ABW1GD25_9ACTN
MWLAIACLFIATLSYAAMCAAKPFATCRKCAGLGHTIRTTRSGKPKPGKPCRRCRTTGLRLRIGRRAWNAYTRNRRQATR